MADPTERPQEGPGDDEAPRNPDPQNPQNPQDALAALFAQLGLPLGPGAPGAPGAAGQPDLSALMNQLGAVMGPMGGSMPFGGARPGADDWGWLKDMVRQMSAGLGPDPSPTPAQQRQLADSVRLADLWLDETVQMPALTSTPAVWSRADWIEQTFPSWRPLAEPVIRALAGALGQVPGESDPNDPLGMITQMLAPMMEDLARRMYGAQFAQALAQLSREVVSSSDAGFQLASPRVALLADNIARHFGDIAADGAH